MKLPRLRSLSGETFGDAPEWFKTFLDQLNTFLFDVYGSLSGLSDIEIVEDIVFTTTSGSALSYVRLQNPLDSRPRSVQLAYIRPTQPASSTALTVGNPIWRLNDSGQIIIDHIGGLEASTQYRASFLVLP